MGNACFWESMHWCPSPTQPLNLIIPSQIDLLKTHSSSCCLEKSPLPPGHIILLPCVAQVTNSLAPCSPQHRRSHNTANHVVSEGRRNQETTRLGLGIWALGSCGRAPSPAGLEGWPRAAVGTAAEAGVSSEWLQWLVESRVKAGVGRPVKRQGAAGQGGSWSKAAAWLSEVVLLATKETSCEGGGGGHHVNQDGGRREMERKKERKEGRRWKEMKINLSVSYFWSVHARSLRHAHAGLATSCENYPP